MTELSVKDLHEFITNQLSNRVLRLYKSHHIITEADLQSHVHHMLSSFISKRESKHGYNKVLNKPFFKELQLYPDIVIFRNKKPWIIFELKEKKKVNKDKLQIEYNDFRREKKHFKSLKRGYLLYVAYRGTGKCQVKPKKEDKGFFYEIPIVMESKIKSKFKLDKWIDNRKFWAKYAKEKKN